MRNFAIWMLIIWVGCGVGMAQTPTPTPTPTPYDLQPGIYVYQNDLQPFVLNQVTRYYGLQQVPSATPTTAPGQPTNTPFPTLAPDPTPTCCASGSGNGVILVESQETPVADNDPDDLYFDFSDDFTVGLVGNEVDISVVYPDTPTPAPTATPINTSTPIDTATPIPTSTPPLIRSFFNGTFQESFNALETSNGTIVSLSVEQSGGGDLTMQFSDGDTVLDCSPAQTITLTAGSDTIPIANYVYVLQSTKAITVSTSDWPSAEHIKIAYLLVPSATYVQGDGAYINQNWNDHLSGTDNMGHMAHMAERSRRLGAIWHDGVAGNGTDDYLTISGSTVDWKSTSGTIYQMHKHTFPAKDTSGGDDVHVVNWDGESYKVFTNLYLVNEDSTGTSIGNNRFFNLVFFGVANKTGQYEPVMINLPDGTYANLSDAQNDVNGYDNYSIPHEFTADSSTGFLICRMTIKKTATSWEYQSTVDLRGTTPSSVSGGATGAITEFADNQFEVHDETDTSKEVVFDVGTNVGTGTTVTLTIPSSDGVVATTSQTDGSIDHGADVTGLGDDDHSQYVLNSGESTDITGGTFDLTTSGDVYANEFNVDTNEALNDDVINFHTTLDLMTFKYSVSNGQFELSNDLEITGICSATTELTTNEISTLGTSWDTADGSCVSIGRMNHSGWTSTELISTAEEFDYLTAGSLGLGAHIIVDNESNTGPLFIASGQFDCYGSENATTYRGLGGNVITESGITANKIEGLVGQINLTSGGTLTDGICVWAELDIDGLFSGGDVYGFKFEWDDFHSGTGDDFHAFYGSGNPDTGSGNFTNGYGLYLADLECATNEYGIYQAGSDDQNHFDGNVDIGNGCDITGNITATGTATISDNVDSTHYIGRASICSPYSDFAVFTHRDRRSTTSYGFMHNASGAIYINTGSVQNINFRENNSTVGLFNGSTNDWYFDASTTFSVDASANAIGLGTGSVDSHSGLRLHIKDSDVSSTAYADTKMIIEDNNTAYISFLADSGETSYQGIMFSDGTSGANQYAGYMTYKHDADELRLSAGNASKNTDLRIDNDGLFCNLDSGTGTYYTRWDSGTEEIFYYTSARWHKSDIVDFRLSEKDIDRYLSIPLRKYNRVSTGIPEIGFIADEVAKRHKWMATHEYVDDPRQKNDPDAIQYPRVKTDRWEGVRHDYIPFMNFAAVKRNNERIKKLESTVEEQGELISKLLKRIEMLERKANE